MTVSTKGAAPFLDVRAPDFAFTGPDVAAARETHWYADTQAGPLVLRHREAAALLADRRLTAAGTLHLGVHGVTDGPVHDYFSVNLSSWPTRDHASARAAFAPFLGSHRLAGARERARELADTLTGHLADGATYDFVSDFASPLTLRVFCHLVGIPEEDGARFGPASADVGLLFGLSLDGLRPRVEADLAQLYAYFEELWDRRIQDPGDDVVSALVAAQRRHGFDVRQCLSGLISLAMGGHDAPMHQLANAVVTLAEHPEQWELLARHPELAHRAVEELLRWTPHTHTMRFALEDLTFNGLALHAGDSIMSCNAAANRDPRTFAEPDVLDLTRERDTPPIAFGGGPYYCPGSALGHMELEVALLALTRALRPPEIAGPVRWRPATTTAYGPEELPVVFRRR